ncbi:MAG TPA: DNA/RNA non-specific endonuclease [Tenuifilaceae bacterium]|nr:DNA/RNA non-specific endonuclease [Tenuifilaceae bacterium]
MRKFFALFFFCLAFSFLFGQTSDSFNYQAIIRNTDGTVIANRQVDVRVTILQGDVNGTSVCSESFSLPTNNYGLVNLKIGSVNNQSFESIDWSNGPYFIKVDVDINGGANYVTMGTSQLLSVPYALYAKTSGSISETDPVFSAHPSSTITSDNISNWNLSYSWGNHANAGYLKSYTETDPVFTAHPSSSITSSNITNWNEAYSWGNHQGLYRPISYVPSWNEITNKPTFATVATSGNYNDLTNKPEGANIGDMQYWNGTNWVAIPVGQPGQYLQINSSGIPVWSGGAYPTVNTVSVSNITYTTAVSGGNVTNDGGYSVTERGVCWNTNTNPTTANFKTSDGSGTGTYSSNITGLTSGETYHVRAYATNSVGTMYGNDIVFTTTAELASVSTTSATSITSTSATCGGNVLSSGGASVTERGVCWSITANPTISDSKVTSGTGTGSFTCSVTGLTSSTTYHFRAYATNSGGTAYGSDETFTTETVTVSDNSNLLLGNPSNATNDISNENNYLMEKTQYSLSYNNSKLTPNWTCWHLYSGDLGSTDRQDNFRADADLPSSWYHVTSSDFQYSTYGFDRGHMCPSADRTASVEDNSATFLMDNMIPQAPNNNQRTWGDLENYCRTLVNAGNELYIVSGPYGQGGTSAKGTFDEISVNSGMNFITVPSQTWKIVVVLTNGDNDLSRISTTTRVIAVIMPNTQACNEHPWSYYRVSVDSLESLTSYDFLSNVPTSIQNVIEARVDDESI